RFSSSPAFASPGGWAYCLLLAASAVSFVLRGRALHPGRLLVWLALAALSLYQARAIPFFAVAAGPLLALNLQEWAVARQESRSANRRTRFSIFDPRSSTLIRGGGALVGVGLLVLAWPGWLQPAPYQPRAWSVEPDGSLVRLAQHLEAEEGGTPERHVA